MSSGKFGVPLDAKDILSLSRFNRDNELSKKTTRIYQVDHRLGSYLKK